MLLLDRNNEPTSTVYYLAASVYDYIGKHDVVDASNLYQGVMIDFVGRKVSYDFFLMALDFLYLLDCVAVDEKGGLHVH
ncbi:ABC-three component system middle component 6 [Bifidobacterium dentium]|uniref:ABC-three component system middle component 6 n=1 Tax=Bifidobacterium dentium TaxID=1689 RepID=UPI003A5218C0